MGVSVTLCRSNSTLGVDNIIFADVIVPPHTLSRCCGANNLSCSSPFHFLSGGERQPKNDPAAIGSQHSFDQGLPACSCSTLHNLLFCQNTQPVLLKTSSSVSFNLISCAHILNLLYRATRLR